MVEVANAIAAADLSGENVSTEDIAQALASSGDTLGVWVGGRLAGYSIVDPPDVDVDLSVVQLKGGIHPDHRRHGVGGPLFDWSTARAIQLSRDTHPDLTATVDIEIQSVNAGGLALAVARGYKPIRYDSAMQRPYDSAMQRPYDEAPVAIAPVPEGFQAITFTPEYDEPLRLAHNEIFIDHWGTAPKTEDDWRTWFTGHRAFRPNLSCLVLNADRIAAYALAYEFLPDTQATGVRELWIGQVGTRREHRGRGLARSALMAVLRTGESAGFQRAALNVDSANLTGAHHLYEQLGFQTVTTKILHRLPLTAHPVGD
jgi:GNAT superfamily N-acetyltransferase